MKLNATTARTAKGHGPGTQRDVMSERPKGFGMRVTQDTKGKVTRRFFFRYVSPVDGKRKRMPIAETQFGKARSRAVEIQTAVLAKKDPLIELEERNARKAIERASRMSVSALVLHAHEHHYVPDRSPATAKAVKQIHDAYIDGTALGKMAIKTVQRRDVLRWHRTLSAKAPGAADRALACLSKCFSLAEGWELRDPSMNPCKGIERNASKKNSPVGRPRERYLSEAEYRALHQAMAEAAAQGEDAIQLAGIGLILVCGLRHGEALSLKWSDIRRGEIVVDGKRGLRTVALTPAAKRILDSLPKVRGCDWVFPSPRETKTGHYYSFQPGWERLRERAGLQGVRLHDLRRSYAVMAIKHGAGLADVGELLGDKSLETVRRHYALVERERRDKKARKVARAIAAFGDD